MTFCFFFKHKEAYEMRITDWSSDVCSSDLVALLRFQGHGRDGASLQPREGDRLSRHFAIAIFTFVDAAQRCVDLGDQLALAVTGTKLDRPIGLVRCAVGHIRLAQ